MMSVIIAKVGIVGKYKLIGIIAPVRENPLTAENTLAGEDVPAGRQTITRGHMQCSKTILYS